jgi:tetratricopeptide (TPR) repeat protein
VNAASRLHGLDERTLAALRDSAAALQGRNVGQAVEAARRAARTAPDHPEVLRRLALALVAAGSAGEAAVVIARAVAQWPDDAVLANAQGMVLWSAMRRAEAIAAFRRASSLAPQSADIAFHLGQALAANGDDAEAVGAFEQTLALAADHRAARLALAELLLQQRERLGDGIEQLRTLLRRNPADAVAWSALTEVDRYRFDDADIAALEGLRAAPHAAADTRIRASFALAKAYEDRGDHARALAAYAQGNVAMRAQQPWDAAGFAREVDTMLATFPQALPDAAERGAGVVFIVSLPRAGSTLTEQILAAHPQVCGGGERTELRDLIAQENRRAGEQSLAGWAGHATGADWRRLGDAYLSSIAPERDGKPVFTDKLPGNWIWLGAALAMLPGARVVDCRRDPLEAAWACYRRLFAGGGQNFSYDFRSIGRFMRDYERCMAHWRALYPDRIYDLRYEALAAGFEGEVRRLLAFCGLPFDAACLRFHEHARRVHTISFTQVREPMRRDTARAAGYGALLDPLRAELDPRDAAS